MPIPTEPIGSIPRPAELIKGIQAFQEGALSQQKLDALYDAAIRDTIARFEATGSSVITDGEQSKSNFVTYSIHRADNIAPVRPMQIPISRLPNNLPAYPSSRRLLLRRPSVCSILRRALRATHTRRLLLIWLRKLKQIIVVVSNKAHTMYKLTLPRGGGLSNSIPRGNSSRVLWI
ncbi:MAG: Methionine synthase II (cobalamin-independent) [Chloroflexi bacterium AL-W]|nr:Methionine synthase II (cobalamin-independent) [Chloroflexi bacterium AL-N1]NOK65221.1 Methionine synthase II (cobalamin-independent) [Chloroflexi bacterium AL-N10]NOK72514.1 Methionine synthase II (cobalamin-independent) [Chloroflexi bacterium AL-N5]NOK79400.1 Methionine synthase II (cobalamin-independent) [Chloroflexi bacterium AL-W]NOK87316.1 Methionine synthase II (cobalamin-independent) [Chloroflexi bacterium AL-N15]